jgi:membrane protease YdiL (CAAX protease family)
MIGMNTGISGVKTDSKSPGRLTCWLESLIIGLGVPAAIWIISKLISSSIPAAVHGSPAQRFLLWILGGVIAEWAFVIAVWFRLRAHGSSFRDIGVWRSGTWAAWVMALLFAALSIGSNLRLLPLMHIPISYAFMPRGFHLGAALLMGITAGFCEEVLFRAFLMTEFANAGYGKVMQVLGPGIAFGLAHAGYLNQGFFPWLGIMLPTAFLGMMWAIAYLLGRRSLLPVMVAHFLNDATALPWITFLMVTGSLGRA